MNLDDFDNLGYEVDDDGYIIRIIVYLNDEDTANIIANVIENISRKC